MKSAKLWTSAAVVTAAMVGAYALTQGLHPGAAMADTPQAIVVGGVKLATKVDNFRLADANFNSQELYRLTDAPAVVLITTAVGSPAVRADAPAYKALREKYAAKGAEFFMLNSTLTDKREAILADSKALGLDIGVLMDANQLVGEQLGVTKTAEVIVVNPKTWQIVYRGPASSGGKDLADQALAGLIAGQPVTLAYLPATGANISFPGRANTAAIAKISYVNDIAPMVREKCVACHQPGGIGPMELTSYDKIKGFAPMIRETVRTQRMPPYHADPSVGHFQDDKRLSQAQIQTLVHWIEAGSPRGAGNDPLAAVKFQAPEWPLGKPDMVLEIPAFTIPAKGVVDYQTPFVANPQISGRWIKATTIKVEQRQGVHHVLTSYVPPAAPGAGGGGFAAAGRAGGISVGGYAVGSESFVAPSNSGTFLPAGGGVRFQNHYTPFGKEAVDHSQVGVYFYPEGQKPKLMIRSAVIADPGLSIPAGEGRHREVAYATFPQEALLFGILPHAHYRGDSVQISAVYPDGHETLLVAVPHYDFNWQREYTFATPLKVPAGTKIVARYTYDNSTRNPANPDPKRVITWGEQSWEEMLYTAVRYQWTGETTDNQKPEYAAALAASMQFGMLDDNVNGKIELSELNGRIGAAMRPLFAVADANKDGGIDEKELAAASSLMGGGLGGRGRGAAAAAPAPSAAPMPRPGG